ncbi:hypothetical protein HYT57_05205 [Candidatus Woesearchaeota archaeon]|nr:hypothetical protein [Candidatus Woesearchaeota archaeon]
MVDRLLMFYGTECTHCHDMDPLVERLEKEEKVKVVKLEVWHNSKNDELRKKLDTIDCRGVPFFFNEKTNKGLCGAVPYATFKKWALGK